MVIIDGEPWFVVTDVLRALSLDLNCRGEPIVTKVRSMLDAEELTLKRVQGKDRNGREYNRDTLIMTESGLYKLIMRSDKPEAKAFQDWVTKVVLPAIRKDGAYVMGEEKVATGELSEDEFVLKAWITAPSFPTGSPPRPTGRSTVTCPTR